MKPSMLSIKWGTDYIMPVHVRKQGKNQAFYGPVGLGDVDHDYFGRVEDMTGVKRPAFNIAFNTDIKRILEQTLLLRLLPL